MKWTVLTLFVRYLWFSIWCGILTSEQHLLFYSTNDSFNSLTGVWCSWSNELRWWCFCTCKVTSIFPNTYMHSLTYICARAHTHIILSIGSCRADIIDYGTAFNLTMYLTNETDYIVWSRVSSSITYVRDMLSSDTVVYPKLQVRRPLAFFFLKKTNNFKIPVNVWIQCTDSLYIMVKTCIRKDAIVLIFMGLVPNCIFYFIGTVPWSCWVHIKTTWMGW